jgi:hypothetical protein
MPPISLSTALLSVVSHFLWSSSLKPCIRLVLKILWVGDELVKGCERPPDLGGAGRSHMLAAMLERQFNREFQTARPAPGTKRGALPIGLTSEAGTGFLVWAICVVNAWESWVVPTTQSCFVRIAGVL